MESPFKAFVSSLFESRLKAKKSKNDAMSFVYKILMNSLYGRFGINPKSTTTVIRDNARRRSLLKNTNFLFSEMLSEKDWVVSYRSNTGDESNYWNPPKNSAVQIAAAITAHARIYMYPYISREDCYYTYTDSVVLGNPLPENLVSSSVLGMFKLESCIASGRFLAAKAYYYIDEDGKEVSKFKGSAKKHVTPEWFELQHADPSRIKKVNDERFFHIDWHKVIIRRKVSPINIG